MYRRIGLWALVCGSIILLSACRVSMPDWVPSLDRVPFLGDRQQREDSSGATTVRLVGPAGAAAADAALQQAVDAFNADQGAIRATAHLTATYTDLLPSILAGDTPVDLIYVDSFDVPTLASTGALLPYSALLSEAELAALTQDFYPALTDAFSYDGELYCLPQEFDTLALVYNRSLFDEAAQAYPTDVWTWDELTAAGQAISELPATFFTTYGLALNADFSRWLPFLYGAGGRVLSVSGTNTALDSETALQSLDFYLNMILDGLAVRPLDLSSSWSGEAFGKGRVGMVVEGNWIVPYLEQEFPTLQFGIAPLPAGPAGRSTLIFSRCYAIVAGSSHPEDALALALHLISPDVLRARMAAQASAPARISLGETWLAQRPIMEPFLRGVAYARPWQLGPGLQEMVAAVNSGMVQVLNGDIPTEEVLRVADVIGNRILSGESAPAGDALE